MCVCVCLQPSDRPEQQTRPPARPPLSGSVLLTTPYQPPSPPHTGPAGGWTGFSTSASGGASGVTDDMLSVDDLANTRTPAMGAGPNTSWPTVVASVAPGRVGPRVQRNFLATSHEWRRVADYGGVNIAAWTEIFTMLAPSPLMRIGGASQDALTEAPGPETWEALRALRDATGARFIIGLPLAQRNALELSRTIMQDARATLGASVVGFELGNEV